MNGVIAETGCGRAACGAATSFGGGKGAQSLWLQSAPAATKWWSQSLCAGEELFESSPLKHGFRCLFYALKSRLISSPSPSTATSSTEPSLKMTQKRVSEILTKLVISCSK